MKIEELKGRHVKIGRSSITCIGDNGKTAGVVTGVTRYLDARPNVQIEYSRALRAAGIWPDHIESVILHGSKLYYLHNLQPIETYNRIFAGVEGFEREALSANKRLAAAEKAATVATVIPCYM